MEKKIIDYAAAARNDDGKTRWLVIGAIECYARLMMDVGRDLSDFMMILDASKIRHTFNTHGDPVKEAKQGQRAITENDIARIPEVVNFYDCARLSEKRANGGLEVVEFVKRFEDGEFHYRTEIRTGRKHLAPATLFIKVSKTPCGRPVIVSPQPPTSETTARLATL